MFCRSIQYLTYVFRLDVYIRNTNTIFVKVNSLVSSSQINNDIVCKKFNGKNTININPKSVLIDAVWIIHTDFLCVQTNNKPSIIPNIKNINHLFFRFTFQYF